MKNKRERGQSLVELAISLVIMLWLLSGAVEFGLAFFQFVQLRDAAQEGALYGSTHPTAVTTTGGIIDRIKGSSATPIDLPNKVNSGAPDAVTVTVSATIPASPGVPAVVIRYDVDPTGYLAIACEGDGHGIRVDVIYNHAVFMPFMSKMIGATLPLHASVEDTILTPHCP
jgi:predicted secreted protein